MKTPNLDYSNQTFASAPNQRNNPLHGLTLETIVSALVSYYGWTELAEHIPINCFSNDPSIKSSLKFLRKTPWALTKVEELYGFMLRDINPTQFGN